MSSKFSNRPAVRKRPWLCKTSPPALAVPAMPASLTATASMSFSVPPYAKPLLSLSVLIVPFIPGTVWEGTYHFAPDWVRVTFNWNFPATTAQALISWNIGGIIDSDTYEPNAISPWPFILHESTIAIPVTGLPKWRILITN